MNLPDNDTEILAYAILQKIAKLMIIEASPYNPENISKQNKIDKLKKQYYELIRKTT